jgi:hypothetical protein
MCKYTSRAGSSEEAGKLSVARGLKNEQATKDTKLQSASHSERKFCAIGYL